MLKSTAAASTGFTVGASYSGVTSPGFRCARKFQLQRAKLLGLCLVDESNDTAGHVASITSSNANGANVSYTYDSLNRLSTVVDSRLGTTTYTYDPASNVATVTYPNGVQS